MKKKKSLLTNAEQAQIQQKMAEFAALVDADKPQRYAPMMPKTRGQRILAALKQTQQRESARM